MNYVDKLFKQHPFVYCINNRYYAFGFGVCSKLDDNNSFLRNKYSLYIDSLKEEITDFEAWKIFLKVMNEANLKKRTIGY